MDNVPYLVITTGDGGGKLFFNDVWTLQLNTDLVSGSWRQVAVTGTIPAVRYGAVGGIVGSTFLVSHGLGDERYGETFSLDLSDIENQRGSWTEIHEDITPYNPYAPHPRCFGAGRTLPDGQLVLFGGCLTGGGSGGPCPSNDGWIMDTKRNWKRLDNLPPATISAIMVHMPLSDTVVLYGGKLKSGQVLAHSELSDDTLFVLHTGTLKWNSLDTSGSSVPERRESPLMTSYSNGQDEGIMLWGGRGARTGKYDEELYQLAENGETDAMFSSSTDTGKTSYPWFTLWMLHGIFMFLGWGIFLQCGAFIARYFRHRDPWWFKMHRKVNIIGLLFSFVGLILGFLSANTAAPKHFVTTHAIIGLFIMIVGMLQPLNAFFRPHLDGKHRNLWSLFHKYLGRIALVLALVNITLGLLMAVVVTALWISWLILLGIYVCMYVAMEVMHQRKGKAKKNDDKQDNVEQITTPN